MPRESLESKATKPLLSAVATIPAPRPPPDLPEAAHRHWWGFLASRPPNYFDAASRPMLVMLCRTLADLERLEAAAAGLDPLNDLDALAKLTRLVDAHRARASQCMTRLRLTPQSVTDSRTAGRAAAAGGRITGVAALEALRAIADDE